jgi:hypothetical protein
MWRLAPQIRRPTSTSIETSNPRLRPNSATWFLRAPDSTALALPAMARQSSNAGSKRVTFQPKDCRIRNVAARVRNGPSDAHRPGRASSSRASPNAIVSKEASDCNPRWRCPRANTASTRFMRTIGGGAQSLDPNASARDYAVGLFTTYDKWWAQRVFPHHTNGTSRYRSFWQYSI